MILRQSLNPEYKDGILSSHNGQEEDGSLIETVPTPLVSHVAATFQSLHRSQSVSSSSC